MLFKVVSRQSQISEPIISKQKPFVYKVDDVMAHLNLFCQKKYRYELRPMSEVKIMQLCSPLIFLS